MLLTVGRAVDKKGFDDLLRALALLPAGLHWRLMHVGGGPLLPQLAALARELRVDDRVRWLRSLDLFVNEVLPAV